MSNSNVIEAKLHVRYHTSELKSVATTFAAPTPMCAMNASGAYTAHTSECFQCKHISYLYSILMESCIRRAVRGEFILRFYPATHAIPRKDEARVKTTHLAYLYRACRVCSRNIKYKGKYFNIGRQTHTNNGACSSVCAYIRVPLCISVCNVPDLMERPEKNAAAAPTSRRNKHDFPSLRKIRKCFSFTRSVMHPSIAKFHLDWVGRLENNLKISIPYSICLCSLTGIYIMLLYINMSLCYIYRYCINTISVF